MYGLLYLCKLLYMFLVETPPIIRSTKNCNYGICHWSNFGKCSVLSQLKMKGMDPTVSATFRDSGNSVVPRRKIRDFYRFFSVKL
jgi:hypothetical protein